MGKVVDSIEQARSAVTATGDKNLHAVVNLFDAALSEIDGMERDNMQYSDGRPMSAERLFKISPTGRAIVELAEAINNA